ncbi:class I SAM-dependent methyltransferase [Gloeocapsopsis crepidinum LEGE 06123]|uniref:Class I SAM-dependent methyltransferase n=1 Tax=Gloeocapsopsis crepidinum LEGE 06123 TaxID=588587 RepID=A0ABR9UN87_9CHRO|nr:class I SAM-dependent methyltransferase [Gloeocapsopsis crepidinum LEGE 06123]
MNKEKISLGATQETLLITLWARAVEASQPEPILFDPKAADILAQIDYDFEQFSKAKSSQMIVCLRSQTIDQWVKAFLNNNPAGTVVEIGAGLNTRFERLDNGTLNWFDLDLPDAIAVRRLYLEESDRRHFLSKSALEPDWIDAVKATTSNPPLFIAEGVLVYFSEEQVKMLLTMLADNFPGGFLAFDATSWLAVRYRRRFDAIKHTCAKFQWGIENIKEIEAWDLRYKIEASLYLSDFLPYLRRFSWGDRLLFALMPQLLQMYGIHLVRLGGSPSANVLSITDQS